MGPPKFHVRKLLALPDLLLARRLVSFSHRLAAICPNSPIAREKQTGSDSDPPPPPTCPGFACDAGVGLTAQIADAVPLFRTSNGSRSPFKLPPLRSLNRR